MLATTTLKYAASRGRQRPERFVGGPAAILEGSFGKGAFEQLGLAQATTQASEEAVEVNAVA
jgi:hypothetical protein